MNMSKSRHVYGPVPSRRLGRSLGIDLVPFKTCTFDCVYCQLGRTTNLTLKRREYVLIEEVLAELEEKLALGDAPDYISLAGSGEPTLNSGIGSLIEKIKNLTNTPVAVLTNGSLLWMDEVRDALMAADLVIPSLDVGDEDLFRFVNRPHRELFFEGVVEGIAGFTARFPREVWLEVFLLAGVTGIRREAEKIAEQVRRIRPARVQLNTVHRPPVQDFALPLSSGQMEALRTLFPGKVEIISSPAETASSPPGARAPEQEEILALLSRRPCTFEDVAAGLGLNRLDVLKRLDQLLAAAQVKTVITEGRTFYAPVEPEKAAG
jgi:wyosine [tRNA(Phe)-imidazoG37] synthetase (radical SAM superfamily)